MRMRISCSENVKQCDTNARRQSVARTCFLPAVVAPINRSKSTFLCPRLNRVYCSTMGRASLNRTHILWSFNNKPRINNKPRYLCMKMKLL